MAKIPTTGKVTIGDIAAEWQGPKDLAELSKKLPLNMSGTEQVGIDDFRGKEKPNLFTQATGGTITTDGDYKYHTFTSNGTFTVTLVPDPTFADSWAPEAADIQVLMIGGGSGGRGGSGVGPSGGGGGGAGGMREETITSSVGSKAVVIGAGGSADAKATITTVAGLVTAYEGGLAGGHNQAGERGASGGGGGGRLDIMGTLQPAKPGGPNYDNVPDQGNRGGTASTASGGGGGGAGGNGGGTNGGAGRVAIINGTTYCGGGGGSGAAGGSGGGGSGSTGAGNAATNYGSGGGGGRSSHSGTDGKGYQGLVIFKYRYKDDGKRLKSDQNIFDHAPAIEESPDYNPSTHKAVLNMIDDPTQETIGWTVVELTDEEKAAYAKALEEMEE